MSSKPALSTAVNDRKARLASLKSQSLKRKAPADDSQELARGDEQPADSVSSLYISGRNYDVAARGPKLGFESAPNEREANKNTLEAQAAVLEAEARRKQQEEREEAEQDGQVDMLLLRPKKQNWDLKREYAERTRVLDQRTEVALQKLLRQRLQQQREENIKKLNGEAAKASEPVTGFESGADLAEAVRLRELEEENEAAREKELEDADNHVHGEGESLV